MDCTNCHFQSQAYLNSDKSNIPESFLSGCNKLDTYDWLKSIPDKGTSDIVEVRFKNTHKDFFRNVNNIRLKRGDIIVLEADRGHDIGIVSLTGNLSLKQYKLKIKSPERYELRKIYRKATFHDIQKWNESKELEIPVLHKAKKIIADIGIQMKLSDVEFRGDKAKATFYYTADGRIDFRELIKIFADEFNIRIEMKQIGARQEAGRIGGIGSCGRELCCSTWRTNLVTVSIQAIKYQELPQNAQRFAGQCGKLKCCLMYELDTYLDNWNDFPEELLELETDKGNLYRVKVDVLKKIVWYSYQKDSTINAIPLSVERVKEIIMLNKRGGKPFVKESLKGSDTDTGNYIIR